jgi:hypothetical protein
LITLPVIISLRDWADQIVLDLDAYGPIPRLVDEDKWQEWAVAFCVISGISQKNPPNPLYFSDWREWASRFAQVMT